MPGRAAPQGPLITPDRPNPFVPIEDQYLSSAPSGRANPSGAESENIFLNGPPERNLNPYDTQGGSTSPVYSDALSEASHFLNLIDQNQYGPAWQDAGPLLKDCVTEDQWIGAMYKTRRPLGNVRSRKATGQQIQDRLPHGTRGYFVLLRYDTQFAGSNKGREELALMRDEFGRFRAVSYYVRK